MSKEGLLESVVGMHKRVSYCDLKQGNHIEIWENLVKVLTVGTQVLLQHVFHLITPYPGLHFYQNRTITGIYMYRTCTISLRTNLGHVFRCSRSWCIGILVEQCMHISDGAL